MARSIPNHFGGVAPGAPALDAGVSCGAVGRSGCTLVLVSGSPIDFSFNARAALLQLNRSPARDIDVLGRPTASNLYFVWAAKDTKGRGPVRLGAAAIHEDPMSGRARREQHGP